MGNLPFPSGPMFPWEMKEWNMLTIQELVNANKIRCERDFDHILGSWSLLEWAGAACGEVGEAANKAKKLKRISQGLDRFNKPGETKESLTRELGDEIADGIHYLVLLSAAAGIDLEDVLKSKFNEVSSRVGSPIRL